MQDCNFFSLDAEYRVLKENRFVIFGTGKAGKKVYYYLKNNGVEPEFFCDNNKEKWGNLCCGKLIISPDELKGCRNDVVVLIASTYEKEICDTLKKIGVDRLITYSEYNFVKDVVEANRLVDENSFFSKDEDIKNEWAVQRNKLRMEARRVLSRSKQYKNGKDEWLLAIAPPKTGNMTIQSSCNYYDVPILFTGHTVEWLFEDIMKQVTDVKYKIITGIRDPLAQQLSYIFQVLYSFRYDKRILEKNGVQLIFDEYYVKQKMKEDNYVSRRMNLFGQSFDQIEFFENQIKKFFKIDVYEYDFNKEEGYAVISNENVEIFIYQLEKMNSLTDEIKSFIGAEGEFELMLTNEAESKWYDRYYKFAKDHIQLSKSYVDYYYDSQFMQHFYSQEDIEKIRKRWESQITRI